MVLFCFLVTGVPVNPMKHACGRTPHASVRLAELPTMALVDQGKDVVVLDLVAAFAGPSNLSMTEVMMRL